MKIYDTKVLLIISVVPTQIGVTVFLIYGLCTQDVTANACSRSKYVAKKPLIKRSELLMSERKQRIAEISWPPGYQSLLPCLVTRFK